jgi:uncharacterized protein (TIGR04255 family)
MTSSSPGGSVDSASVAPAVWLFPDAPRVQYGKNPLTQVICQLTFPPVLRVETELPAGFQEKVRDAFPLYKDGTGRVPGARVPKEVLRVLRGVGVDLAAALGPRLHTFSTVDGHWVVTLAKEFVAVTANDYRRWENFRRQLDLTLDALQAEYRPAHYTRIGLRYRNVIRRDELGVGGQPWHELLQHQLTGELTAPDIAPHVEGATRETILRLPRFSSKVHIRHGLAAAEGGEVAYVIDNDFYLDQVTECSDVLSVLQYFSGEAHRLFRWCISDSLHRSMGPEPIERA